MQISYKIEIVPPIFFSFSDNCICTGCNKQLMHLQICTFRCSAFYSVSPSVLQVSLTFCLFVHLSVSPSEWSFWPHGDNLSKTFFSPVVRSINRQHPLIASPPSFYANANIFLSSLFPDSRFTNKVLFLDALVFA